MAKRTALDAFLGQRDKRLKQETESLDKGRQGETSYRKYSAYPIPLPESLPLPLTVQSACRAINDKLDLDLLYYRPLYPAALARQLFEFLRAEFCWYRVTYEVRNMTINTPRFTSVFGLDDTHVFRPNTDVVLEKATQKAPKKPLRCRPRPLPGCLDQLKVAVESVTGEKFNFCLLNYYKDGTDSISYHSDDESFLGQNPSIASISLGSSRDFLMRNKEDHSLSFKTVLRSGEMVLMRGTTQSKWDHSIPKRKGDIGGRINITFRKAVVRYGTENYYRYNVHDGPYYRWDPKQETMILGSAFMEKQDSRASEARDVPSTEPDSAPLKDSLIKESSFDLEAEVRAIETASAPVPVKLDKEESTDIEAQVRAIDEAVARNS